MLFNSLTFLTTFLPIVAALYFLVRGRVRNGVLLLASLTFYLWGSGSRVLVLIAAGLIAWVVGGIIARKAQAGESTRTATIVGTVLLLSPLLWFKYARWFSEIIGSVTEVVGVEFPEIGSTDLPIGISFFTFQALSYLFDVQRGDAPTQRRFSDFLLYLSLFPQLIAGPIVRYGSVAEQLTNRTSTADGVTRGLQRFVHGLAKKVLIADSVAGVVDASFGVGEISTVGAWVGALAYAVQIYFDFSGYSDMAIGLGLMFGFTFPENFKRPYSALSITDFWRRWHITLSEWFRDYVYIPLGGNRNGTGRQYFNLVTVFALTALWHGAAWTFLAWGALHAALLIIERLTGANHTKVETSRSPVFARARTAVLVVLFWVVFRAADMGEAIDLWKSMLWWNEGGLYPTQWTALNPKAAFMLVLGVLSFLLPRDFSGPKVLQDIKGQAGAAIRPATTALTLAASMAFIAAGGLSPFLYFQF